jgi:hypothetical protein
MNTRNFNTVGVMGGALLILLGLVFFAATQGIFGLTWGNIWPIYPVILGLLPLGQAFATSDPARRGWLAASGTFLILLGLYFFTFTLDYFAWGDQGTLWPVYVLIGGVALLAGYVASRFEKYAYLVTGGIITAAGALLLAGSLSGVLYNWFDAEHFFGFSLNDETLTFLATYWPVVPILVGAALLTMAVMADGQGRRAALVTFGTIPLLMGLFLFATTLGILDWDAQGTLWPLYPLIIGVSLLAGFLVSGTGNRGLLISGLGFASIGAIFLGITLYGDYSLLGQIWPVYLIIAGLLMLVPRVRHGAPR